MKFVPSPLFEPVLWEERGFRILDETLIPERIEYISVGEVGQALEAVREMRTRAFGQVLTFLYSGALIAQRHQGTDAEPLRAAIAEMTRRFSEARPTFDFPGLGGFLARFFSELPAGAAAGDWIAARARAFAGEIIEARQARAKRAAAMLPPQARVLTHCNVSGELVAVAHYCREMGKEISVIASETRPYLQGTRLTAWELSRSGIPVSLIPDSAVAQVMARGAVNAVVVGADRSAQNGDVINKVGTYPLALMAQAYTIPFYALVQDPGPLRCGADATIEERPAHELLTFQAEPLIPDGAGQVDGRYPAFDVTPAGLISGLIGFDDCFTPEAFRKRYLQSALPQNNRASQPAEKYLLVYGVPKNDSYAFLAHALRAEQAERVLVPEMRPALFGARIVARELLRRHTPTTLIADNMMGTLFARGEIRRLYLFYDGLDERGASGICGALLAVRLARAHHVPIELLESAGDKGSATDADVATFLGRKVMPVGVAVYPLEEEAIPWALLKEGADS